MASEKAGWLLTSLLNHYPQWLLSKKVNVSTMSMVEQVNVAFGATGIVPEAGIGGAGV